MVALLVGLALMPAIVASATRLIRELPSLISIADVAESRLIALVVVKRAQRFRESRNR